MPERLDILDIPVGWTHALQSGQCYLKMDMYIFKLVEVLSMILMLTRNLWRLLTSSSQMSLLLRRLKDNTPNKNHINMAINAKLKKTKICKDAVLYLRNS